MVDKLRIKCENLMTFIQSNLYIHTIGQDETMLFSRLNIPDFLSHYIDDAVKRLMLEKEGKKKESSNQVNLYIDPFKFSYLTWPMINDEGIQSTITLGPMITQHLTKEEIRYMGYKMKLGSDNMFILESFYGTVPYYDQLQMARIASMFLDYLAVEPHLPRIIREDHSINMPVEAKSIENKFEHFDFVEKNYETEKLMLEAIEKGDLDYIDNLFSGTDASMQIPSRYPSDPLREKKNLAITMNSIAMRAALKGGLNQSISHSLSHNFAITIESQTSPEAIDELTGNILRTYVQSVRKYGLKGHSDMIINAINYIRRHLTEKVSLKEVADELHLSPEHLSRKFKEEMAMNITDYIHKVKIEESCSLLTSKLYSVSDIAYIFGYSSPAHYTKTFKKVLGKSPKQWQMNTSKQA